MTRVGIFSDSHGDCRALDELLLQMGHIDAACFLGDIARDAAHLEERLSQLPHQPPLYAVRGNNDFACALPDERLAELGGVRIYMTHGHLITSPMALACRAKECGAMVALFGHTHAPLCDYALGVLLLNPGSAGNACRGGRARASVLEIDGGTFRVRDVRM
ncbi:MAG: metallophosphoesterase family protein [Candidatus Ventricola sp.]